MLAVLTMLAMLVLVAFVAAFASSRAPAAHSTGNAGLRPNVIGATTIYLNRSQSSGTYVNEYVTLNNSSTLTKLPATLTGINGCRWVTVVNLTTAASPVSVFHNVQFHNVTSANNTGTLARSAPAFQACAASAYWINYAYWTYSIYRFTTVGLGINATITVKNFSAWPGTTSAPAAVSATVGPLSVAQFKISTNLTNFTVYVPTPVNGATSCDATGQVCSFTQYSYVSASDVSNVTTKSKIVFNTASGLRVTAAYENWTIGYSNASVAADTATGAFFTSAGSLFSATIVEFWWVIVIAVLIVIAVAAMMSRRRHGR